MKKILILLYLAFSQNVFCYVGNTLPSTLEKWQAHCLTFENNMKFEFQISPISFEAGGEQLRGFAELGFGNYLMAAGLKL